jgi:tRNA threonylcarbamoyladenosine modification (KEOPS) complex  Pcc1 subunit
MPSLWVKDLREEATQCQKDNSGTIIDLFIDPFRFDGSDNILSVPFILIFHFIIVMSRNYPYSMRVAIPGDPRTINAVACALEPEVGETDRSDVQLDQNEDELILIIRANDVIALRAAMNSYLRWIQEAWTIHLQSQN